MNNKPVMAGLIDGKPVTHITVAMEQEMIDVTSATEPDPTWTYVDRKGHFHAYTEDKDASHYPTLKTSHVHIECSLGGLDGKCEDSGGCDGYWDGSLVCVICEQEITPATKASSERHYVPGMKSWTVEATGMWTDPGEAVSVRLNDARGLPMYFGVAVCHDMRYGSNDTMYTAVYHGIGPLCTVGKKKVKR